MDLDNALWFAYIGVEAVVVGLLFYRRLYRILPVFCAFCIWDIASNIAAYAINRYHPAIYFQAYFTQTIIDSAFQFCVLVELVWSVLRPVRTSLSRKAIFVVAAIILIAGAAIWPFAAFSGLSSVGSRQWLLLTQLQHTVSLLRILMFLSLAAGSQYLSIGWRDRELQVATGLGFYSIANMAISIAQAHQNTGPEYVRLQQLVVISYLCSLLYWAFSFLQKEAVRREFTPQMQRVLLTMAGAARSTRISLEESRKANTPQQNR